MPNVIIFGKFEGEFRQRTLTLYSNESGFVVKPVNIRIHDNVIIVSDSLRVAVTSKQ